MTPPFILLFNFLKVWFKTGLMHIALFPFSTFLRTGTMSVIPAVPFFTFIIFITGMPLQSSAASFPAKERLPPELLRFLNCGRSSVIFTGVTSGCFVSSLIAAATKDTASTWFRSSSAFSRYSSSPVPGTLPADSQ